MKKLLSLLMMLMSVTTAWASLTEQPVIFTRHVTVEGGAPVIEYTEAPEITVVDDADAQTVTVTATGNGHICLYNDDVLVAEGEGVAEYVIAYGEDPEGEEYGFSATAQEQDKEVSEYALATVFVPGKPAPVQTDAPDISIFVDMDAETVTIIATGNGHICLYNDDVLVAEGEGVAEYVVPFTVDPEGEEMGFAATAQVEGELISDYARVTVEIPGKTPEPYQTPAPVVETELTDEALVITVTGEGAVTLFVQYINNETGEMTTEEEYAGEGTVVVPVARGTEDAYINYWAVAQANDDAVPAITEIEYYVMVPATEQVVPEDPHANGWWIVLTGRYGDELWYELHQSADGSWVTTLTLDYATYGGYRPDIDPVRQVPFHFVVDGLVWGAPEADMATLIGADYMMSNPLYENENNYTVPVGYNYALGIYVDPSETDWLGDGTFYYVYSAQGPRTGGNPADYADGDDGVRGDVDADGEVTIADVVILIDYILTHDDSSVNLDNADSDLDGEVSIADVVAIIDYIIGRTW